MTQTFTENGAVSNATTGDARVNHFFKVVRNTPEPTLYQLLTDSWATDELDTVKLTYHLRDCRGGKGEKKQFYDSIKWFIDNGRLAEVEENLEHVPFYGSWKDLLQLLVLLKNTPDHERVRSRVLGMFVDRLAKDKVEMENSRPITLCAKWTPTENSHFDKQLRTTGFLSKRLGMNRGEFRKLLSGMREYSKVPERQMCLGEWDGIEYSLVPSRSMKQHRKAFEKHSPERFAEWLAAVKAGTEKINASQVFPHELVKHYLGNGQYDEVIEQQWRAIVEKARETFKDARALSIVDVSGSMAGTPMEVAIALGMLLAEIMPEPFRNQLITFSAQPAFFEMTGKTLKERVDQVRRMPWGMNTNIQSVFELISKRCKEFNVPEDEMPQRLYIFSDMQFDNASTTSTSAGGWGYNYQSTGGLTKSLTNHDEMVEKFRNRGFNPPGIVYWNLRGDTVDFPAGTGTGNVAMVSGFSQTLMDLFLVGEELVPMTILRRALDNPRYDRLRLSPTTAPTTPTTPTPGGEKTIVEEVVDDTGNAGTTPNPDQSEQKKGWFW